jgi:tripartite ATP-independent transporter DctM subunit
LTPTLIAIAVLLVLLMVRFPLGLSLMTVGFAGLWVVRDLTTAMSVVGFEVLSIATNFNFAVLPLFILMGVLVARAKLSDDLFEASDAWLGHFRGGLAMATVAACGGFAAVSGSSGATAATMAKVAIPSMRKYGYSDSLAAGTVAAGGTIGILIPPSAALIVYGILTESDIGALFIAGILPGILTVILYILVISLVVRIKPDIGPPGSRTDWPQRFRSLTKVWGIVVLFLLIVGGIFFGLFTPSESGAIGAVGAYLFALGRGKMSFKILVLSLIEAGRITALVFAIAFGALVLNQFINLAGMPEAILKFIESLSMAPIGVVLIIMGIYILLGMFIEGLSMIFLTAPIFVPVIEGLGMDVIWFGIVMVMVVEISLITPPIGLNVFILKAMLPEVPLPTIFKGIGPFFAADLVRLLIVVLFPGFVLFLPRLMN